MSQKELSLWLRGVVVLALVCCAGLAVWAALPGGFDMSGLTVFFWVTLLPVLAALMLCWRIFADIGRDRSFTEKNARRLRSISRLALLDTLLYVVGLAVVIVQGNIAILLFTAIIIIGVAMTVLCAALSHLTKKAADMKSENDLTI